MPGGKGNIKPSDNPKPFSKGNKVAEKWTEEEALIFGNDLLDWMLVDDENIFFDDFIYLQDHTGKYVGEISSTLPAYLSNKFSTFSNILNKCRQIEKTKLKKFSAFDKINVSIAKFLLSAEYGLSEKTEQKKEVEKTIKILSINPLSNGSDNSPE